MFSSVSGVATSHTWSHTDPNNFCFSVKMKICALDIDVLFMPVNTGSSASVWVIRLGHLQYLKFFIFIFTYITFAMSIENGHSFEFWQSSH